MLLFIHECIFSLIFHSVKYSLQHAAEDMTHRADRISCSVITSAELHAECEIMLLVNFSVMKRLSGVRNTVRVEEMCCRPSPDLTNSADVSYQLYLYILQKKKEVLKFGNLVFGNAAYKRQLRLKMIQLL